jgi:hypothetical protein
LSYPDLGSEDEIGQDTAQDHAMADRHRAGPAVSGGVPAVSIQA